MIEVFSAVALFIMTLLGHLLSIFDFKEMFKMSYKSLLLFIIFGRCFLTISKSKEVSEKTRILFETILFTFCSADLVILYLINIGDFFKSNLPSCFIYINCGLFFILTKIYVLKVNIYGKRYTIWQLIDFSLIILLTIISYQLKNIALSFNTVIFILLIFCTLGYINERILRKLDYWVANLALISNINYLIKTNNIETITKQPIKKLKKDPIFSKCIIILEKSTFRPLGSIYLYRLVRKTLMDNGYKYLEAHNIATKFHGVLENNLMRRSLDDSFIPSRILNFIYSREKK